MKFVSKTLPYVSLLFCVWISCVSGVTQECADIDDPCGFAAEGDAPSSSSVFCYTEEPKFINFVDFNPSVENPIVVNIVSDVEVTVLFKKTEAPSLSGVTVWSPIYPEMEHPDPIFDEVAGELTLEFGHIPTPSPVVEDEVEPSSAWKMSSYFVFVWIMAATALLSPTKNVHILLILIFSAGLFQTILAVCDSEVVVEITLPQGLLPEHFRFETGQSQYVNECLDEDLVEQCESYSICKDALAALETDGCQAASATDCLLSEHISGGGRGYDIFKEIWQCIVRRGGGGVTVITDGSINVTPGETDEPVHSIEFSQQPQRQGSDGYDKDETAKREFYCSSTEDFEDSDPSTWYYYFVISNDRMDLDGFGPREVLVVNETIPGPTIYACEKDTVIVKVLNNLEVEQTAIHWHGIYQRNNQYMDGVAMVSQCPIGSQQHEPENNTFTYQWIAEPHGTTWYHAHSGLQYGDGLFGGLIIFEYENDGVYDDDYYDEEVPVIFLYDWWHDLTEVVYSGLFFGESGADRGLPGKCDNEFSGNGDFVCTGGGATSDLRWVAGIMNSEGQYDDPSPGGNSGSYHKVHVQSGTRYRMRFVNSGSDFGYRVSIDNHTFDVIATDMQYMKIITGLSAFVFFPGERYDIILHADQDEGQDYWIRGTTFKISTWKFDFNAEPEPMFVPNPTEEFFDILGILSYDNLNSDPTTSDTSLDPESRIFDPTRYTTYPNDVTHLTEYFGIEDVNLSPVADVDKTISVNGLMYPNYELFLTSGDGFVFAELNDSVPTVWARPKRPLSVTGGDEMFNRNLDVFVRYGRWQPESLSIANRTHTISIPGNKMIRLYLRNPGPMIHPFHLHGHFFWVLGVGQDLSYQKEGPCCSIPDGGNPDKNPYGAAYFNEFSEPEDGTVGGMYNGTEGHVIIPGFNYRFLNDNWSDNDLNFLDPPRKDTISIPQHGWAMIQFYSDNPGAWFFHCHIEEHLAAGMGLVFLEDVDNWHRWYSQETVDFMNSTECSDIEFRGDLQFFKK